MSVFTKEEIEYINGQKLGRLATVNANGKPQVAPVGFRYNAELDVIEVGGRFMSQTQKYKNLASNPSVSLVIDDVLPPWEVRGVEIRGEAERVTSGGSDFFGANYKADDAFIRIKPTKIIGWGLNKETGWSNNRRV